MDKYIDLTKPLYFIINTETGKAVDACDTWSGAEREAHYLTNKTRTLHTIRASEVEVTNA